jgi:NAD(P)-dependent dehydrogenase (short-subunit alcohol dehydrogenase family)
MANHIDLAGRTAVVTGGAQGIGLLASSAAVAIWERDATGAVFDISGGRAAD